MPNLLAVDDEPSILHFFHRAFQVLEVTLRTASTAAEGVGAVTRDRPDAVVLDINLPDAAGLNVFRRIHPIDSKIPAIFITGHGAAAPNAKETKPSK
jgi:two-component system nitrogen regulation response regulator GlnG